MTTLYEYMDTYAMRYKPPLEDLLARCETDPPREVLMSTHYYYPPPLQMLMSQMILVCSKLMRTDATADRILKDMLIDNPTLYIKELLGRLLELGRILPLDVAGFTELYVNNYYGAALRMYSSHPVEGELWTRSFTVLFTAVIPLEGT